ncbi:hypothetical protein BDR06DRAFT_1001131 [Suillus hirtellus]|nr:hypothetical protein BDR06DRAFT_1001131 [Suillus hirtellus]
MGLISFLSCVARIVVAVLLVILTPTMSIGAGAGGWVIEAVVRILGRVGFDHSRRSVDSGLIGVLSLLGCCGPRRGGRERRHYKATEVRHSPMARDSFAACDSSPYVPLNASFAQKDKGSSPSHHFHLPRILESHSSLFGHGSLNHHNPILIHTFTRLDGRNWSRTFFASKIFEAMN